MKSEGIRRRRKLTTTRKRAKNTPFTPFELSKVGQSTKLEGGTCPKRRPPKLVTNNKPPQRTSSMCVRYEFSSHLQYISINKRNTLPHIS